MRYEALKQNMRRYEEVHQELINVLTVLDWTKSTEEGGKGRHMCLSRIHIDTAIQHIYIDISEEEAIEALAAYKDRLLGELSMLSGSLKIT